ncbi:MAG: response regulator transcription factor [Planctomycetota bacterium]|jgi:DNA-binding response OmpR family regulator
MSRILLVDDEEHLAEGMAFNLRNWGYDVDIAVTGEEALEAVAQSEYDLLLLDVMLPGIDGLEVARRLREGGNTKPILMLTARNRSGDAIAGLDAGADDYICKPFDLDEVLARIRGALRREVWGRAARGALEVEALQYGLWRVDFQSYRAVHADGREFELTAKELAILRLFAARPGEVISRETFLEEVWGLPGSIETRTVDNFMRKLRLALEASPSKPEHILSVRGAGYRFNP